MTGIAKKSWRSERGAVVIVEAAFVFPIMFIILFFLIYMGNAFYIKAQVEGVVAERAIEGAAYCADPLLQSIRSGKGIPELSQLETKPYRHLFGGNEEIETLIDRAVRADISGNTGTFFKNMQPKIKSSGSLANFENHIIYSTFSVEVGYTVTFPIRFLGESTPPVLSISSRAEVPVNDTTEFIRNSDMVIDLLHGTKVGDAISKVFGKVNEFIGAFAEK